MKRRSNWAKLREHKRQEQRVTLLNKDYTIQTSCLFSKKNPSVKDPVLTQAMPLTTKLQSK